VQAEPGHRQKRYRRDGENRKRHPPAFPRRGRGRGPLVLREILDLRAQLGDRLVAQLRRGLQRAEDDFIEAHIDPHAVGLRGRRAQFFAR
jgi:hypothetical protein